MRDLKEVHSSSYINSVLIEALKDFNIEYNIKRLVIFISLIFFKILIN